MTKQNDQASLEQLLEINQRYCEDYRNHSRLMNLIKSDLMKDKSQRARLLDCIQVFSNYFQKTVMLRSVFCENRHYLPVVDDHLKDEFGHNTDLDRDRQHRDPVWDPILESTSAWFAWNMLVMDNDEKVISVHLVLESSANIFFTEANKVMKAFGETDYFAIHSEVDGDHEQMGIELLQNLQPSRYQRLMEVQAHCWDVLNTACNQIALLTEKSLKIPA